eukprot:1159843-Pelagomonas_calceolata.AAC.5
MLVIWCGPLSQLWAQADVEGRAAAMGPTGGEQAALGSNAGSRPRIMPQHKGAGRAAPGSAELGTAYEPGVCGWGVLRPRNRDKLVQWPVAFTGAPCMLHGQRLIKDGFVDSSPSFLDLPGRALECAVCLACVMGSTPRLPQPHHATHGTCASSAHAFSHGYCMHSWTRLESERDLYAPGPHYCDGILYASKKQAPKNCRVAPCADVPGDWAQRARLVVRELMASPSAISFLEPVDEEEVLELMEPVGDHPRPPSASRSLWDDELGGSKSDHTCLAVCIVEGEEALSITGRPYDPEP